MDKLVIVSKIEMYKPELPNKEVLDAIAFNWNKEGLSAWDGGYDLNESLRSDVVLLLEKVFKTKDTEYAAILRFLLEQEIKHSYEGEVATETLSIVYDSLANLKFYEDIALLLSAIFDTCFDAHCALYKDRLFYNGYDNVMKYIKSNYAINKEIIEQIQFCAETLGYDK